MRPLPQLCPQGTHIPVFTARFPLQGALQALPVTGLEPDTQRSPQTTPPRELLTPVGGRWGLVPVPDGGQPSCLLARARFSCSEVPPFILIPGFPLTPGHAFLQSSLKDGPWINC